MMTPAYLVLWVFSLSLSLSQMWPETDRFSADNERSAFCLPQSWFLSGLGDRSIEWVGEEVELLLQSARPMDGGWRMVEWSGAVMRNCFCRPKSAELSVSTARPERSKAILSKQDGKAI